MAILDSYIITLLKEKDFFDKNPAAGTHAVSDDQQIPISISFTGDIHAIEAAGFHSNGIFGTVSFGSADMEGLRALAVHPQVTRIEGPKTYHLMLDVSVPDIGANQLWTQTGNDFTGYTGKGVIVGIIDSGIDIMHRVFQTPDGKSRIVAIWDQTLTLQAGEKPPDSINNLNVAAGTIALNYGVEYTNQSQQIDNSIKNPKNPVVRHKDGDGHGTHVAGIAAGNGSVGADCTGAYHYIGVAPDADIIVVRTWGSSPVDTGASPTVAAGRSYIMDAIAYIVNKAKPQSGLPQQPCAINISLGGVSHTMDGTDNTSKAVDDLLNKNAGLAIVFAAGNSGANYAHARVTVPAFGKLNLPFLIGDKDSTTRAVTIVYQGANLQLSLVSPYPTNEIVTVGDPTNTVANQGGKVSVTPQLNSIFIVIAPPAGGTNLSGAWTINIVNNVPDATTIDAWCDYSNPNDPSAHRFADSTQCTSLSTLSETAAGIESISVGNYAITGKSAHTLDDTSSRGPTTDHDPGTQGRIKPDLCAPGNNIKSAGHVAGSCDCCCACCQTNYKALSGTSMSAPHVTGTVALMLHKNPTLSHVDIKKYLLANPSAVDPMASDDTREGWGVGGLQVKNTMDLVPQVNPPKTTPITAMDPAYAAGLGEQLLGTPNGKSLHGLFERYFPELLDLVNHNKRVATRWHRCKGPVWTRLAMQAFYTPGMRVRTEIDGLSLREAIARFQEVLIEYASLAFNRDARRLEPLLVHLSEEMTIAEMIKLVGNFKYDTA